MAIQINFQCNESWDNMPNSDQGKFCGKCSKNIYDLTNKTEDEIHQLYQKNKGKLCGKIKAVQLSSSFRKQQIKLAKFCMALFLVFGGALFKPELQAQNTPADTVMITNNDTEQYVTVKGKVIDKGTKESLFAASVYYVVDDQSYGTVTDFDGNYKLKISTALLQNSSVEIFFSMVGYKKVMVKSISFSDKNMMKLDVSLDYDAEIMLLGEMIISCPPIINKDPASHGETIITGDEIRRSPY